MSKSGIRKAFVITETFSQTLRESLCVDLSPKVLIGMKVLQANSIILGTRKLWGIFLIKQKFDTTVVFFLDYSNFSIWSSLVMLLAVFSTYFHNENTFRNITNLDQIDIF